MCGVILGVLELLQPTLFLPQRRINAATALVPTLDTFMALFREHGHLHRMGGHVARLAQLLADWVACGGGQAHAYIRAHAHTLQLLHQHHPQMPNVRALAAMSSVGLQQQQQALTAAAEEGAVASVSGTDGIDADGNDRVLSASAASSLACVRGSAGHGALPQWLLAQVLDLQARLAALPAAPEERLELLKKAGEFPERWQAQVLPMFSQWVYEGVAWGGAGGREVRAVAWTLLVRLVHACPGVGARAARCVEEAVGSCDVGVRDAAVEQLPDLVLLLHPHAPQLLVAAFAAVVAASSAASASVAAISESLTLLHLNTGS